MESNTAAQQITSTARKVVVSIAYILVVCLMFLVFINMLSFTTAALTAGGYLGMTAFEMTLAAGYSTLFSQFVGGVVGVVFYTVWTAPIFFFESIA